MALNNPTDKQFVVEVTIAASGTTSTAADLADYCLKAVQIPASMTSTALTFTATTDDSTYVPVRDNTNAAVSVTISTAAGIFMVPADSFAGLQKIKVVAGSTESSDRTLKLICYKA